MYPRLETLSRLLKLNQKSYGSEWVDERRENFCPDLERLGSNPDSNAAQTLTNISMLSTSRYCAVIGNEVGRRGRVPNVSARALTLPKCGQRSVPDGSPKNTQVLRTSLSAVAALAILTASPRRTPPPEKTIG